MAGVDIPTWVDLVQICLQKIEKFGGEGCFVRGLGSWQLRQRGSTSAFDVPPSSMAMVMQVIALCCIGLPNPTSQRHTYA